MFVVVSVLLGLEFVSMAVGRVSGPAAATAAASMSRATFLSLRRRKRELLCGCFLLRLEMGFGAVLLLKFTPEELPDEFVRYF